MTAVFRNDTIDEPVSDSIDTPSFWERIWDIIYGLWDISGGDDTPNGGAGDDTLDGGAGADTPDGGA